VNPSTALATVVVDELLRGGVREAVLSPGSRNAPLSFALHAADAAGRLRLHVRIDERSAGFLALGLAKASGSPVPVVTTSGTAAVNLHPAVVEADWSGVRLVVLTADRPAEMRGTGANQTIDQVALYGGSVRAFAELSADREPAAADWRRVVEGALARGVDGPVHVNVELREPLVPDGDPTWPEPLESPPAAGDAPGEQAPSYQPLHTAGRTLVVAGDRARPDARAVAEDGGWPLLAEPSSGVRSGPNALGAYRLTLDTLGEDVERVVVTGRPTLSRPVTRLLARSDVEVVRLRDDARTPEVLGAHDGAWLRRWQDADRAARKAVDGVLDVEPLGGPAVARTLAAAVGPDALLVAGSSSAVRDLDLADPWDEAPLVLANRGASGIDGTVSAAWGAALAHQRAGGGPAYALVGDLTFLHDSNGLVTGPDEPRPDLTVVVVNDDGGGLFTLLEQGEREHQAVFERVFGTPHGVDLAPLCAATSTPHTHVTVPDDLRRELRPAEGVRVVEVPVERSRARDLHAMLRAAVESALR
jgi:2-succinyl-5-enolpyruvyl-6-hydroxy-3-cyclohexene-1-carboxylate synthase